MNQKERIHDLTPERNAGWNVIYWMSREQRAEDNPGLLYAQQLALEMDTGLLVVFTLTADYPGAMLRHYDFMIRGLHETATGLHALHVPFHLVVGDPAEEMDACIRKLGAGTVITDFDPMRIKRQWVSAAIKRSGAKFLEVDGHNIVPARMVSDKVEFGAYTLRPKIHRHLDRFLEVWPSMRPMAKHTALPDLFSPDGLLDALDLDRSVGPVDWIAPGSKAAERMLEAFTRERLDGYSKQRNDPNLRMTSDLSPYLHFGQISALRVAARVLKDHPAGDDSAAFLEELIVRKELSDNFCHYHPGYDTSSGFHDWAKKSHEAHRRDEREYIYSTEQFEEGTTHDPLWNAAQLQMVKKGKMHGYMRMYWAKKILEWTPSPEQAMETAIYLNDKYELDGRDPNGYTGIAWAIGGVHDRAWTERPVYGKIRYMNYNGAKRKFDVATYIRSVQEM
jgi:deoxyribodipyrimidine photo-lyase